MKDILNFIPEGIIIKNRKTEEIEFCNDGLQHMISDLEAERVD